MVARAISSSSSAFHGARPFDQRTDLFAVACLLEETFRPDHSFPFSDSPVLRQMGIWLWTLNYAPAFPEALNGFVWIEDGKIVGNVTLAFDQGRNDRYYISNVAVKPEYRRQGIARALMQTTLDHIRARDGTRVLLNVRPNNPGAIKLYETLGFNSLETRGDWTLAPAEFFPTEKLAEGLRPLTLRDERAVTELVRAATPRDVSPYRPRQGDFALDWDALIAEALTDFFTFQATQRWTIEHAGNLAGVAMARGKHLVSPHRIAIHTHPDFRGQVEDNLVAVTLNHLAKFPRREIRIEATDTHPELIAALERHRFQFSNGLTLMQLDL